MEIKKIACQLKHIAAEIKAASWNADFAAKITLEFIKKFHSRDRDHIHGITRFYMSGKNQVSFDGWSGNFTIWFEDDEEGTGSSISISGESPSEVDNVFYKHFDEMLFDDEKDLQDTLTKCFNEVVDMIGE